MDAGDVSDAFSTELDMEGGSEHDGHDLRHRIAFSTDDDAGDNDDELEEGIDDSEDMTGSHSQSHSEDTDTIYDSHGENSKLGDGGIFPYKNRNKKGIAAKRDACMSRVNIPEAQVEALARKLEKRRREKDEHIENLRNQLHSIPAMPLIAPIRGTGVPEAVEVALTGSSARCKSLPTLTFIDVDPPDPEPELEKQSFSKLTQKRLQKEKERGVLHLAERQEVYRYKPKKLQNHSVQEAQVRRILGLKANHLKNGVSSVNSVAHKRHSGVNDPDFPSLQFDSVFESGNLSHAYLVSVGKNWAAYDLYCSNDVNTRGHIQWYFYSVTGGKSGDVVEFTFKNMAKPDSLYNYGMQPCVYTSESAKRGIGWHRDGFDVSYFRAPFATAQGSKDKYKMGNDEKGGDLNRKLVWGDDRAHNAKEHFDRNRPRKKKSKKAKRVMYLRFSYKFVHNNDRAE